MEMNVNFVLMWVPEPGEVKASVAALVFILSTSARHTVDSDTLSSELQQLGLPREHATALCRVYSDNLTSIPNQLRNQSLRCEQNTKNIHYLYIL